jgi:hypothetical protein
MARIIARATTVGVPLVNRPERRDRLAAPVTVALAKRRT